MTETQNKKVSAGMNTLELEGITFQSSEKSLDEMISLLRGLLQDENIQKYLQLKKAKSELNGSYCG